MAITGSAWTCAFDCGWSLSLSEEDFGLPLESQVLAADESGNASSSDPSRDVYFQCGGDEITVDAYLVLDQCLLAPLPPPPPRPGGGEVAGADCLPCDGRRDASSSDSTSVQSWFQQFGGDVSLDDDLLNQDLPALSISAGDEIRMRGGTTPVDAMDGLRIGDAAQGASGGDVLVFDGSGDASSLDSTSVQSSFQQFGGDVSLDDDLLNQDLPALSISAGDGIHVQGGTTGTDDEMNGLCIRDAAQGASGGDVLVFGGSGDASSSDSTSVQSWFQQFGGDVSLDDDLLNQDLPALSISAGDEICVQGGDVLVEADLLVFDGSGDASSSDSTSVQSWFQQFGGDVSLDDDNLLNQDLPALSISITGDEICVQGGTTGTDDEMNGLCIRDTAQGDVLGEADALVIDGSGDASSSDSTSVLDSWFPFGSGSSSDDHDNLLKIQGLPVSAGRRWPVKAPSESIGVDERENGTWEAHIWLKDFNIDRQKKEKNGMQFFLGSFSSEEDAKRAHDKAAIMLDVRVNRYGTLYSLNYPQEQYASYIADHANWSRRDYMWKMRRESGKFSKGACSLKGVARKKNRKSGEATGYTATLSVTTTIDGVKRKTTMTIGQFETEDEAGREYDKALLFIKGVYDSGCITNFRPGCYSAAEVQEAGQRLATAYPRVNFKELTRKHSGVFAQQSSVTCTKI